MKVAILYICTGDYSRFWDNFYNSAELYFCKQVEKKYFVFTDDSNIESSDKVQVLHQDNFGWPLNTLYRYRMFLRISESLAEFDWVVFFNANCEFRMEINQSEFFGEGNNLIACIHPGYFDKEKDSYTYERRAASTACVTNQVKYFPGGLMGGRPETFLDICAQLKRNIEADFDNGIIAIWHDESHWNAYLNNNFESLKERLQILNPSYLYPEGWTIPFTSKIVLRDKSKVIDVAKVKGLSISKQNSAKRLLPRLLAERLQRRMKKIFGMSKSK